MPARLASWTTLIARDCCAISPGFRTAKEQTTPLSNLSSAFLDGLTTAVTQGLLTQDVWEAFDSLDRARQHHRCRIRMLPMRHNTQRPDMRLQAYALIRIYRPWKP